MNGSNTSSHSATGEPGAQAPFRIAIIGGAIGGLAAALFLDHFCRTTAKTQGRHHQHVPIAIDVYEQASEYREIGAGVGLGVNATALLHVVPGLGEGMAGIEGRSDNSWFTFVRWDDGRCVTHLDAPVRDGGAVKPLSMARSEFLDLLLEKIREKNAARLHTRKRFVSVKVCATFNGRAM